MRKQDESEWREQLLADLPEEASAAVEKFARSVEEINPPLIIYARESVPERDCFEMIQTGIMGDWEEKYHWGAKCRCTACGESFIGGYKEGHALFLQMEDGTLLDGWTDGEQPETAAFKEGEKMECPLCGVTGELVKRSRIRGRSYRTQIVELTNIRKTTVLLYWLAAYWLEKEGYQWAGIWPRMAVAVSPSGRLYRFSHSNIYMHAEYDQNGWRTIQKMDDPELIPYNEGGGMFRDTFGGYYICTAEDMQGTTGEKTGIFRYFNNKNANKAATYLRVWKKHPNIENIANTGGELLAKGITDCFVTGTGTGYRYVFSENGKISIDLKERKPHRIIGVTKPEYNLITKEGWTLGGLEMFLDYRSIRPKTTAMQFDSWAETMGWESIDRLRPWWADGIENMIRYFIKQEQENDVGDIVMFYADYRRMLDSIRTESGIVAKMTTAEMFPPNLVNAHNRANDALGAINREKKKRGGSEAQFKTFAELKAKLSALEWKNGEYCIIIPESPEELVREGETLKHCVGGYASKHCSGEMIFFVRHARRPERSWFTLNENVNGSAVHRIQLHGYGNEYAHGKRLKIPKTVIEFVEQWEKTVLAPYLKENRRKTA